MQMTGQEEEKLGEVWMHNVKNTGERYTTKSADITPHTLKISCYCSNKVTLTVSVRIMKLYYIVVH